METKPVSIPKMVAMRSGAVVKLVMPSMASAESCSRFQWLLPNLRSAWSKSISFFLKTYPAEESLGVALALAHLPQGVYTLAVEQPEVAHILQYIEAR